MSITNPADLDGIRRTGRIVASALEAMRREAVLSSQIEGTQASLSDLLLFELEEAPDVPFDDVVEVSNYVAALEHGMARLRGGFPLSKLRTKDVCLTATHA